jgi:hypothetical protein
MTAVEVEVEAEGIRPPVLVMRTRTSLMIAPITVKKAPEAFKATPPRTPQEDKEGFQT